MLLLAALALLLPFGAYAQEFPELTGRVTDAASIIPEDAEAQLTQKLAALEQQSQRQVVVATIPDLQGYDIADYGYRLGREWGIGDKERNDGALLIVAPNERKVRIEVGYGLEPILTDGMSFLIVNQEILPRFKQGDMPGGIAAGVDAMIEQLTLPEDEARQIAAEANSRQEESGSGFLPFLFFNGFILLFFIMRIIRHKPSYGQRYRGSRMGGAPILWAPGGFGGRSSGGFSGGFGGGGGSFGGGGASGGW